MDKKYKKEKLEMEFLINKLINEDISNRVYIIGVDGLGGAGKSTLVNSLKLQRVGFRSGVCIGFAS
jgi:putative protein kinase ArgK-like GTPase of G3E family